MINLIEYHNNKILKSEFHKLDFELNQDNKEIYFASYLANLANFGAIDITFNLEIIKVVKEAINNSCKKAIEIGKELEGTPLLFLLA